MLSDLINAGRPVRFHTQDESRVYISRACGKSGDRAEMEVIGRSEQGTGIYAVTMGRGPLKVALAAGAHADEPVGPETLRLLVVTAFTKPEAMGDLLERCTFYIVPHVNPDNEAANVRTWGQEWPSAVEYIRSAAREAPGRDVEFGYPAMRPENRAVSEFLRARGPLDLYVNLHGMSFAEGGMLLIERRWADRPAVASLRAGFIEALHEAGLGLHDQDRGGEKGFAYLGPGFTTTPEGAAMRAHFEKSGDPETAALFHDSSMEFVRSLGGDPLCLVTELPLFSMKNSNTPGRAENYTKLRAALPSLQLRAARGESIEDTLNEFELRPLDLATAIRLQLRVIELGIEAVSGSKPLTS
jgi:hypothetical protein